MPSLDLRLVPARPEHVDFWIALREEPETGRLMALEPASREVLLQRILSATHDPGDSQATSFRWMVECDGQLIGTVSARELSRFHGRVEVGYMLSSAWHGRGLGTRAVAGVLDLLFTAWPFLHRVWLTTSTFNLPSQALARKLGFTYEGVMRGHYFIHGQHEGLQFWGLLRPEWEARRADLPRPFATPGGAEPR